MGRMPLRCRRFQLFNRSIQAGLGRTLSRSRRDFDQQGQIDVGGLTPGLYQVRLAGPNQEGHVALVEVTANSARTLDLSAPSRDMARITLRFDGIADSDSNSRQRSQWRSAGDFDRHRYTSWKLFFNGNQGGGPNLGRRDQRDPNADRVLEVPPGRYEVVLQGRPNIFLTGLDRERSRDRGTICDRGCGRVDADGACGEWPRES